jgi:pyrimidine deaminase RibD-like protein
MSLTYPTTRTASCRSNGSSASIWRSDGVTAYVTLEPCSFQGRTPSYAKAPVASGIDRVIVAMLDPDPRNAGAGIEILRAGGIDVSVGLLEYEAIADLQPYLQSHS